MRQNITVASLLERSEQPSELNRVLDYVVVLNTLTSYVRSIIPAPLSETTRVVYAEKYRLKLESNSLGERMALIRLIPKIIDKMSEHLPNLKDIDVIVSQASSEASSPPAPCRTLSLESASMIQCVADMAPPDLRKALEKLARHHKS